MTLLLDPIDFPDAANDNGVPLPDLATRQDGLHHLTLALADADAAARQGLDDARAQWFAGDGLSLPTFGAGTRELLALHRKRALRDLPDPSMKEVLGAAFDALEARHLDRAAVADQQARVHARAQGAEQALAGLQEAAVADPDSLHVRIEDAHELLGRMVEAGTDPTAAAERARRFRTDAAQAALDDLAWRDPQGALDRLDAGHFAGLVDNGARGRVQGLADMLQAGAERRRAFDAAEALRAQEKGRRDALDQLEAGLRDGTMDQGHIGGAIYDGHVVGSERDRLLQILSDADAARAHRADRMYQLDQGMRSGGFVFHEPPKQGEIDEWWRHRNKPGLHLLSQLIAATGLVPTDHVNGLRASVLSDDPERLVASAHDFGALRDDQPEVASKVLSMLPDDEAARLSATADYAHLDLPAERISELGEKAMPPLNPGLGGGDDVQLAASEGSNPASSEAGGPSDQEAQAKIDQGTGGMTENERFKLFREKLRPREAGRAPDHGGLTDEGISSTFLEGYNRLHPEKGYSSDPTKLTPEQKTKIYRDEFYDRPQIDKLATVPGLAQAAPNLAEQIFDAGVLHSPQRAGRWLQQSIDEAIGTDLRVETKNGMKSYDGIIGSKTRTALAEAVREGKGAEINNAVVDKRLRAMQVDPNSAESPGWFPRAESFRQKFK